jgi:hypothetical protein
MTDVTTIPYATPLTFRTEVRPYLYLASTGLLVLGLLFVGFALWGPEGQGVMGALICGSGVFMLYAARVDFRPYSGPFFAMVDRLREGKAWTTLA